MKIERSADLSMSPPPESTFTGDVRIGGYFRRNGPSRLAGAIVDFSPGARTPWKVNPFGQTLVVLSGKGLVQAEGHPIVEVSAGDVIWCPPGERHWEGASPDETMRYVALQEEDDGKTVSFLEAVSESDYDAGSEAPQ